MTIEEVCKRLITIKRKQIIADIILIAVFIAIGIYLFIEIDSVKLLLNDPCKICMEKTKSVCYSINPFG